jgi:hypothetical protein
MGFIGYVGNQVLDPLHGLALMLLIRRHGSVPVLKGILHDMGARQLGQEAADMASAHNLVEAVVDNFIDRDRQLLSHDRLQLYTYSIRI